MRVRKAVIIATCMELKSPLKVWSIFWNSCMAIAGSGSLSTMKSKSRSPDGNDFCFSSLHYSTPRLGGAGTGKLRFAEIFGAAICAFDKLGANYRYLSVRRHALRRSLALAADKAPLSPPNGGFLLS